MRTVLPAALAVFLSCSGAAAQTQSADSRTLQAILEELHKLRQDLQATSATVQRSQILLYRVRLQMDVVERASQRLEQARLQSIGAKNEQTHFAGEKKRAEDAAEQTQDPAKRKELEDETSAIQNRLEQLKDGISDAEAREATLNGELQNEKSKLDDLLEQLDRLDKKLEAAAEPAR